MIKYEDIIDAQNFLVEQWGEQGKKVITQVILHETPFEGNFKAFLDECIACGGNWGKMILSGIKEIYPTVYELIPDDMGNGAWGCLCYTLLLLGVDTSE